MTIKSMADVDSGYVASERSWLTFLRCWNEGVSQRRGEEVDLGEKTLKASVESEYAAAIRDTEKRLGIALPKSYKDFVLVTGGAWRVESVSEGREERSPSNLMAVREVGVFQTIDPQSWQSWNRAMQGASPRSVPADQYYRYGHMENPADLQDRFRWEHLGHLMKIGELEQGTVLLLNPREVTSDGEMEAWLLSTQVGAKRYRSFAELMQVLAYQDVLDTGGFFLPPEKLRSTCAVHLTTAATS